jgi:ATP-dependent protease Clp ATPase subunit
VNKLIAGPNVFICDACIESAERTVSGRKGPGPFTEVSKAPPTTPGVTVKLAATIGKRCAFCGKRQGAGRSLVAAPAGRVCTDCLKVCRDIIDASNP